MKYNLFRRYVARVAASPLGSRLVHGMCWTFVGTVGSRVLNLLAMILMARVLGRREYGAFGIIQGTVSTFEIFASFGTGMTVVKYVAEFRRSDPAKAGRIITMSGLMAIGSGAAMTATLFALAPWLAAHSLAAPHLAGPLRLASALLLLGALSGMQLGALSGFEAFGMVARLNLLAGALYLPCVLGGAYLGGISGATGGLVTAMGGNCLVSHMALHAEARRASVPLSLAHTVRERKVLLGFSLPSMLGSAMIAPANWFCATILANRTGGYAELGVYNAANQWFLAVAVLPLIIGRAAFPVLTERLSLGDRASSRWIILSSIRANATIVLPVILVGCLLSRPIMRLYGAAFAEAWPILVIALLTGGLSIIQVPFTNVILAQGHAWTSLLINFAWGLMFYLATHLLIERGAIGLGTARLISTAVSAAATVAAAGLLAHARHYNIQT